MVSFFFFSAIKRAQFWVKILKFADGRCLLSPFRQTSLFTSAQLLFLIVCLTHLFGSTDGLVYSPVTNCSSLIVCLTYLFGSSDGLVYSPVTNCSSLILCLTLLFGSSTIWRCQLLSSIFLNFLTVVLSLLFRLVSWLMSSNAWLTF